MNNFETIFYIVIGLNSGFLLYLNWKIFLVSKEILQVSIDLLKETVIIKHETVAIRHMTDTIKDETILLREIMAGDLDEIQVAKTRRQTSLQEKLSP